MVGPIVELKEFNEKKSTNLKQEDEQENEQEDEQEDEQENEQKNEQENEQDNFTNEEEDDDIHSYSVAALKELAEKKGLTRYKSLRKQQLVDLILAHE